MISKSFKKSLQTKGVRNLTSATHLPKPSQPRDACVSICPGEGVGPKLVESVLEIFESLKIPLKFEMIEYGSLKRGEDNLVLKQNKCLLQGPISNKTTEEESKGVCHSQILKELDIYASIVNALTFPGEEINGKDIDLLIIQQWEEGFQAAFDYEAGYDDVASIWIPPHKRSKNIAEYAFNSAVCGKRKKVTALHQANVRKLWHGEFLQKMRDVANKTESITYDEIKLDEGAVKLVKNPEEFDLIVMPNNWGNVISNIAMSLVGGQSLVPSVHVGDKFTIFQQGGNDPQYEKADENKANPTGFILASSMMLRQANLPSFADLIEDAIFKTYTNTEVRTEDLGGNYNTSEFTHEVIKHIHKRPFDKSNEVCIPNKGSQELA